jgi:hypothetical protein
MISECGGNIDEQWALAVPHNARPRRETMLDRIVLDITVDGTEIRQFALLPCKNIQSHSDIYT